MELGGAEMSKCEACGGEFQPKRRAARDLYEALRELTVMAKNGQLCFRSKNGVPMGMSKKQIDELSPAIIEFSGLGDYINMPVRTYSTGMLMRLAFSISTSVQADILLMDEWLSVGDAEFTEKAEQRMKDVVSSAGILVLASHSQDLIAKECNRVIHLAHGRIVEIS